MSENQRKIISREELQKVLKIKGFFGKVIASFLMRMLWLDRLNRFYCENYDPDCSKFVNNCLTKNNNRLVCSDADYLNIPETGPVVILFNHPYGALDALVIIKSILSRRPDTKFIANFLLSRIEPAAPYLMSVNPFETRKDAFSSLAGLKEMYKQIEAGSAICILPSGEV